MGKRIVEEVKEEEEKKESVFIDGNSKRAKERTRERFEGHERYTCTPVISDLNRCRAREIN